MVAKRHQVARHGQRGRPGADQGDALAVFLCWDGRQVGAYVALVVGGDPLQPADRHRLLLDPAAPAGRLARPVAGAPEDAGKDVRLPIDRPRLGIAPVGDQADVFGHRRMRRTGPLAIDNLMKIVRILDIGGLQYASPADRLTYPIRSHSRRDRPSAPRCPARRMASRDRGSAALIPGLDPTVILAVTDGSQISFADAAACPIPAGRATARRGMAWVRQSAA